MPTHLEITDEIAVLNLGDDENRFSPDWLTTVNGYLDRIESGEAKALVTTGSGKFYSNGLDLDWLAAHSDQHDWYVDRVQQVFARVLVAPVPTVAAINGHAFGAGSMLGMAHDFRVMRVDRGYYCFPEVDIHPFHTGHGGPYPGKAHAGRRRRGDDYRPSLRRRGRRGDRPGDRDRPRRRGYVDGRGPRDRVEGQGSR